MSFERNNSRDSKHSSDSEDMKDLNLDKDDEDIEFEEEKELDEEEDLPSHKKNKKKTRNKDLDINIMKYKVDGSILPPYLSQTKNKFPLSRKLGGKVQYRSSSSSSSSSSDELNMKIKRDLAENLNQKLTNFEKEQSKSQKEIFENNFNVLKNDFKIIEQYEQIILKDTSIDIMFIMDLTGSMQAFLSEAKHNIKKVTEEIIEIHPGAKIRLSFVGYRDFDSIEDIRDYEIVDFTEDINEFTSSIKNLDCYGGGDQPEDVAGGLNEALKLDWKSNAKYVVLVCDAPCHGKKYHDINIDDFGEGDPSGLVIEDLMLKFKNMNITFYCIEINDSTKKMFEIMKKVYDDENRFSVELVGSATEKLTGFVAFTASELLGNAKYDKFSFEQVLNQFRKESIDKIMKKYNQQSENIIDKEKDEDLVTQALINQLDNINIEGEDKKLIEFINRMSNLDLENKKKNEEKDNEDNNYIILDFVQDYFLMNQGEDINYKISGLTYNKNNIKGINSFIKPDIIEQTFNTKIKINFGFPNNKIDSNYNYINFYDNKLCKENTGLIPKKIKKELFTNNKLLVKEFCLNDLICEQIADYFNIEIKPESNNFIKFKKNVIYFKEEQNSNDSDNINKVIISDISLNFPNFFSEIPTKRILQAFTHFSYQITYGEMIIKDFILDKDFKKITDYNIYYLKENGYKKILEFFSGHACSDICKFLGLVHPRKKKSLNEIENYQQFYNQKFLIRYKLCKCCSIPIRKISDENYCCKCSCEKIKSIKKKVCQECHSLFDFSYYECNSQLVDYPNRCKKCTKLF